jgi:outer membrane receptor protein involved in Fe transport
MRSKRVHAPGIVVVIFAFSAFSLLMAASLSRSQESAPAQQLERVDVERPAPRATAAAGDSGSGFGYDQPAPSGMERSDFPLTPGQVVSPTGKAANIASTPTAITVVGNQGIQAQGRTDLRDFVRGVPGVTTGLSNGGTGNPYIGMRGFDGMSSSAQRVAFIFEGRNMETPRGDPQVDFVFPEIIERVEVMRGDGTIQFGNKAIGGAINVLLKKPRQNPGLYYGSEAASYNGERHWVSANLVRGPLAFGVFGGYSFNQGFRVFEGEVETYGGAPYSPRETVTRPGPWEFLNIVSSANWKITPNLTLDFTYTLTRQRLTQPDYVPDDLWERRDTRNVGKAVADGGPDERWDKISILKLLYAGDRLGTLEAVWNGRYWDVRKYDGLFFSVGGNDIKLSRWDDNQLSLKYSRNDSFAFLSNDLMLGTDLRHGWVGFEKKRIHGTVTGTTAAKTLTGLVNNPVLRHKDASSAYRESLAYYVMNQTRLWDRIIVGLGHRVEGYELKDIYYDKIADAAPNPVQVLVAGRRMGWRKSASQYSLNVVYDRELGSDLYYKHSRTYRFPAFSEFQNQTSATGEFHPAPLFFLGPEEGTLEEVGIRHWFTPNLYASVVYYELDMDNQIMREWDTSLTTPLLWTANVPLVAHDGLECEGMFRLTPRWTLRATFTKQKVIYRSDNIKKGNLKVGRLGDKWVGPSPAQMYDVSLIYDNKDWGFSAEIDYYYQGKSYYEKDDFNAGRDTEEMKILNLAASQSFFDGLLTVYGGVKNVNDAKIMGATLYSFATAATAPTYQQWPEPGRTYYGGVKAQLDLDRMKVPTSADLQRMQERLYGNVREGLSGIRDWGAGLRGRLPFLRSRGLR